jgi:hypothetical protein
VTSSSPDGVNAPVCGEPVPARGTKLVAVAARPVPTAADAVKAHAAATRIAPSVSFVFPLDLILSPCSSGHGLTRVRAASRDAGI